MTWHGARRELEIWKTPARPHAKPQRAKELRDGQAAAKKPPRQGPSQVSPSFGLPRRKQLPGVVIGAWRAAFLDIDPGGSFAWVRSAPSELKLDYRRGEGREVGSLPLPGVLPFTLERSRPTRPTGVNPGFASLPHPWLPLGFTHARILARLDPIVRRRRCPLVATLIRLQVGGRAPSLPRCGKHTFRPPVRRAAPEICLPSPRDPRDRLTGFAPAFASKVAFGNHIPRFDGR